MISTIILGTLLSSATQSPPKYEIHLLPNEYYPTAISDTNRIGASMKGRVFLLTLNQKESTWTIEDTPGWTTIRQFDSRGRILFYGKQNSFISNEKFEELTPKFRIPGMVDYLTDAGGIIGHDSVNAFPLTGTRIIPWLIRPDGEVGNIFIPADKELIYPLGIISSNPSGQMILLVKGKKLNEVTGRFDTVVSVLYYKDTGELVGSHDLPYFLWERVQPACYDDQGDFYFSARSQNPSLPSGGYRLSRSGILTELFGATRNTAYLVADSNAKINVGTIPGRDQRNWAVAARAAISTRGGPTYDLNNLATNLSDSIILVACKKINKNGSIIGTARYSYKNQATLNFVAIPVK